ncbi:MAG TPA: SDR family oxidoreductase [Solirubrobacteraceae bacterium]|nr:SDR family oxidoreductase [Solirubrobacteraceae bacterium]
MPFVDLGLSGRVCVVTGASRGIGLATAECLASEGARLLLVARSEQALEEAAKRCHAREAGSVDWLAVDVTDPEAAEEIVACASEQLGGLDALVNNAGTSVARSLDELTDADWQAQWELHVMASMRLMRIAAPRMAERGWGRIVNVCSSAGKRPSLTNMAYSVTKAAQLSLSRAFADSFASSGVLVNAVAPGPVASDLWMAEGGLADQLAAARGVTREEALADQRSKVPLGRFLEPAEIASVIAVLCSEAASAVTGAAWSVDGGTVAVII